MVYTDVNNNGTFESSDLVDTSNLTTICFNGMSGMAPQPISIVYYLPPTDPANALISSIYGLGAGWFIMVNTDSDPYFPSQEEYSDMVISADCVLQ